MRQFLIVVGLCVIALFISGCTILFAEKFEEKQTKSPAKKITPSQSQQAPQPENLPEENLTPQPSESIPDISLTLATGEKVTTKKILEDKALVLYTFTSYCIPCLEELREIENLYPKYKNKIRFIAITIDDKDDASTLINLKKTKLFLTTIDLALYNSDVITVLQGTSPGIKTAISKQGTITQEHSKLDNNEWEDLFEGVLSSSA